MPKKINAHQPYDLAQFQSLPLEAKIRMTKERIEAWYNSWCKFEIEDIKTGKTREVTIDCRDFAAEPPMKETECIKYFYPGQVYVSFSGGKDSTVLKHIVDSMYKDVPAVFVNTGLEYPEIQNFVREVKEGKYACFNSDVEILRPEMRFDEVVKSYGYPVGSKEIADKIEFGRKALARGDKAQYAWYIDGLRISPKTGETYKFMPLSKRFKPLFEASEIPVSQRCCTVMKKKPNKRYAKQTGRKPILGTLASESQLRYSKWIKNGCNAFDIKSPTSQPLSFWTNQDILHYIKKYNVPYCPVYGDIQVKQSREEKLDGQMNLIDYLNCYEEEDILETTGCDRTGCIFCMFGCHLEEAPNRFQRLKETHPRQYKFCIEGGEMVDGKWQPNKEGLGLGKVLDYIGVKYD